MISIRPIRIVPFQIGRVLTPAALSSVFEFLLIRHNWIVRESRGRAKFDTFGTGFVVYKRVGKSLHSIEFGNDGVAIYTVYEQKVSYDDITEINPDDLNFVKGMTNKHILSGTELTTTIGIVIGFVEVECDYCGRIFCNAPGGAEYVFSCFLIRAPTNLLDLEPLKRLVAGILEPGRPQEISRRPQYEMAGAMRSDMSSVCAIVERYTVDRLPFRRVYFSWAAAVVVGEIDISSCGEFVGSTKEIQAVWSYASALEGLLDRAAEDVYSSGKMRSAQDVLARSSRLSLLAKGYVSFGSGRYSRQKLLSNRIIFRNSHLEYLIESISSKTDMVAKLLDISSNMTSRRAQGWTQLTLLALTIVQGVSSYVAIVASSTDVPMYMYAGSIALFVMGIFFTVRARR